MENSEIDLNEELATLYINYHTKINKLASTSLYEEYKANIISPFFTVKKMLRKILFKNIDVPSSKFTNSPLLTLYILSTELDYDQDISKTSDPKEKNWINILKEVDIRTLSAYNTENDEEKIELLNSALDYFNFDKDFIKCDIAFPLDINPIKKYYDDIFIRSSRIFEYMSLIETNYKNKINLLDRAISFNVRIKNSKKIYLIKLKKYLQFYYEGILPNKKLDSIIKIAEQNLKEHLQDFNNWELSVDKFNKSSKSIVAGKKRDYKKEVELFYSKHPISKQFIRTYELIALINKSDPKSLEYIYKIFKENTTVLKSTFSSIDNFKLSKLIYANNLLIDVYSNKKSLQNDIIEFLKNGLINKKETFGLGQSEKKVIENIFKNILKGENINYEWKSTLLSETTNYEIRRCGPRTKLTNIPVKTFLESLNGFMNTEKGGIIYLGISEDKENNNSPMIHGIETDKYDGNDSFNNKINDLVKDFILGGNSRINTTYITIDKEIADKFDIPFDPKPKLEKYSQRTICEVIVELGTMLQFRSF